MFLNTVELAMIFLSFETFQLDKKFHYKLDVKVSKVSDFAKQFFEASDWFTAYNRGKIFNLW